MRGEGRRRKVRAFWRMLEVKNERKREKEGWKEWKESKEGQKQRKRNYREMGGIIR